MLELRRLQLNARLIPREVVAKLVPPGDEVADQPLASSDAARNEKKRGVRVVSPQFRQDQGGAH
ncbi:MAG TPA: hypothetical protein VFU41_14260 [Gemmatimonadales bacterium]|nr:hypothetical protein [Gemmatimonadales bacterium]